MCRQRLTVGLAGKVQTPKTVNSIRQFAIYAKLASHLRTYLSGWQHNRLNLVFANQERNAVGSKPSGQTEVASAARIPQDSALRDACLPTHHGSLMDRLNTPMKIRQERFGDAPGLGLLFGAYTHAIEENDRRVAEQLGEMLCPNVANLAQEKTFAESKGVVIQ